MPKKNLVPDLSQLDESQLINIFVAFTLKNESLSKLLDSDLTIETFMEVQYTILSVLADALGSETVKDAADARSQFVHASLLLSLAGKKPETYFLAAGMSRETIGEIKDGKMSVRRILKTFPRVVLSPLLEHVRTSTH